MNLRRQNLFAIVLLAAIVAAGAYLRLSHLSAYNLIQEELSHYYVGDALAHDRPPALPSGQWYTRGLEYSRLVSLLEGRLDSPEISVRLPSALLGTLCVILMAVGTWIMAGPWAAVGATLLLAIYPEAVTQSRLGRFYMLQLLFFLLAFFGGWLVLKRRLVASPVWTWVGLVAVSAALLVAARIQVTAFPSLLALWLFCAAIGFRDVVSRQATWRHSASLQFAVVTLFGLAVLLLIDPVVIDKAVVRAMSMPYWARVRQAPIYFYVKQLLIDLDAVVLAAPFAFCYVLLRHRALGAYLILMAAVPAFLFSVLLPFKAERFLLLAVPPLFVAVAVATAAVGRALYHWAANRFQRRVASPGARSALAGATVVFAALAVLFAMRTPRTAWSSHWTRNEPLWNQAARILSARSDVKDVPYGGTKSLPPRFYWGRLDFNIGRNFLEQWAFSPLGEAGVSSGRVGAYRTLPVGSPDLYAGVPVLPTAESIRQHFPRAKAVVIGIDGQARYFRMTDSTLLRILETEAEELCRARCGSLQVYLWRFH